MFYFERLYDPAIQLHKQSGTVVRGPLLQIIFSTIKLENIVNIYFNICAYGFIVCNVFSRLFLPVIVLLKVRLNH